MLNGTPTLGSFSVARPWQPLNLATAWVATNAVYIFHHVSTVAQCIAKLDPQNLSICPPLIYICIYIYIFVYIYIYSRTWPPSSCGLGHSLLAGSYPESFMVLDPEKLQPPSSYSI